MTKAILDTQYLIKSELNSWGNSVGFRIPKKILELLGLKKGSKVRLAVKDHKLIIEKDADCEMEDFWREVDKIDVKALAKNINKRNQEVYKEFETKPVGREVW
jgi:antitoxin component of MazEF toxin-antitoxin module